ncbi:MAG: hypothetical protein AAF761_02340 [Pseudomonadota bacterium]
MKELKKLEDRAAKALAQLAEGGGKAKELQAQLTAATQEQKKTQAKLADAQAELEDLRADTDEQDRMDEADIEALTKQIESLGAARQDAFEQMRRSKQYNKHLRKINADLRKANADNLGKPELINQSLEAELEALKAQRETDLADINGLMARLAPLVEGDIDG